jgi:LuxR family maltose regulon positive regulatory protein
VSTQVSGSRSFVAPTRLRLPQVPRNLVSRSRLTRDSVGRRAVTLVCAPAGSGKTLLVADWAARAVSRGESVAWLSLEARDDRPYEFWSAVIEAVIASAGPDGVEGLDALSPPQRGMEPRFIAGLTRAMADSGVHRLVLDDVHRLRDADVLAGLDILLAETVGVELVLVGRSEPAVSLHRLRLADRLDEIRAPDLAFTADEAHELFTLLDVPARPSEVARLVVRTEGWAAGLRLAAVSVAAATDPDTFVAAFEGDERTVADYLFAEIIQHLSPDLVEFLLATCTPVQISVELGAFLSGRSDAGEVLEELCRANALVVRSGDSSWYRYHGLLRTYLVAALGRRDADGPRHQHARAALWFDQQGHAATALEHAVHAEDDDLLHELVRDHGLRMILSGQARVVLDRLPRPGPRTSDQHLATVAALAALDATDLAVADEWLHTAGSVDDRGDDLRRTAMRASAIVQRSLLGGDVESALAQSGILDLSRTGDGDVDLMVLAYRAPARMRTGDYHGAIVDLEEALGLARAGRYDQFVLSSLSQLAGMNGSICDFVASTDWSRQAIDFASRRGWIDSPRLAYAYLLAAWTAFQTGDAAAQTHWAQRGLPALDGVNNVEVEMGVRSMHALATFERSTGADRIRAAQEFHALWQGASVDQVSPALISLATPQEVRITLLAGRTDWAREAAERVQRQMPDSAEAAAVRAQLLAAKGRFEEALKTLRPVLDGRVDPHVPTTTVSVDVLAATLEARVGNAARSFEAIQAALDWAAPNGFRRPFIDAWRDVEPLLTRHRGRFGTAEPFVAALLDEHRDADQQAAMALNGSLSERELSVLRDLPSLMTLHDIAAARALSENTVKTQVRSIYQKLGVNSRAAAVQIARDRGLV